MAPCLAMLSGLASTRKSSWPAPRPLGQEVSAIQSTPAAASHAHSRSVLTVTDPVAPATSTDTVDVDSATWHLVGAGDVDRTGDDPHPAVTTQTATTTASSSAPTMS